MNAQTIAAAFAIALALLGLGTAVVIGLRGTALKADLERVRAANDDLRDEIADKDRHTTEQDEKIEQQGREIVELKAADARKGAALARIGEAAASGAELRELVDIIRDHDREAAGRHAATIRALRDIKAAQGARAPDDQESGP